ncbi:MAG: DUF2169 domain-containing protein [Byssovorax sp.]
MSEPELEPEAPPLTETISLVHVLGTSRRALACVAKRTYSLDASGRLALADQQLPLTAEPEVELDAYGGHKLLCDDTDLGPPKVATDVVFTGSAYAEGRAAEVFAALVVGSFARRLRVCGERRAEVRADGSVRFSTPAPFERVAMSFEHAYGGYDEHAHWTLAPPKPEEIVRFGRPVGLFAYPRNSAGAAYFVDVDRARADGARLPQIEDPSDLLVPERFFVASPRAWIDAPIPGALGWLHHAWYPRMFRFAGPILAHDPPAHPIREIALGEGDDLAALQPLDAGTIHPRALQGAAPGLSRARLRGDEPVILQHLHRESADLRFALPGELPLFTLRPPDVKSFQPKPVLQTVRIEPDAGRISLTWCAVVPVASRVDEDFLDDCDLDVTWSKR